NIKAQDKGTGKEQSIRIESSSGLNEEEIEKMKNAAKEHEEEDKELRERIEKLNQADSLVFSTRKQLDEYGDKISDENKKAIEEALETLEKHHKEENLDELDAAIEAVNKAWSGASEEIYKASQEEAAAGQAAGDGAAEADGSSDAEEGGDDAVDADYEVVDDEDKK
ncbi:MAG: Hsp70 family protein, partial [Balneolaceae bacterium]